tara:strand:+ start:151 stop:381 length:231 start_codon:yes stop_codon:yes gene_type:complete
MLECNIGARGKFVRLVLGFFGLIGSIPFIFMTSYGVIDHNLGMILIAGLVGGGALGIFEGWSGWCVARALGVKTSI